MKEFTVALAGNPNCGKSTIFNALTGSRQHVGNWPGKTVEKKEGYFTHNGKKVKVVDLPGTYSLSAFSKEEMIARDFILDEQPDMVVAVVDSTNLERNLYLVVQLLELGIRVIVDLNMSDLARANRIIIDTDKLAFALQSEVIKTIGSKGDGVEQLKELISIYYQ
ncbi:MAG: FeoB small GTPase domain-containing protein [Pelolinea sp.]|nr:FeoB small GTPase domain-containing protein [Pelolinea sp.]